MNKKLFIISISLLFILPTIAFSSATKLKEISSIGDIKKIEDVIFEIETDKEEYKISEKVKIYFNLTNTLNETITLNCPTSKTHDFIVYKDLTFFGEVNCYQWSENKTFLTMITPIELDPYETKSYTLSWNQKGTIFFFLHPSNFRSFFRIQAKVGDYKIKGWIPAIGDQEYIDYTNISIIL